MPRLTKAKTDTRTTGAIPAIPLPDVLPRVAALKTGTIAELKDQWRSLFAAEPPPL